MNRGRRWRLWPALANSTGEPGALLSVDFDERRPEAVRSAGSGRSVVTIGDDGTAESRPLDDATGAVEAAGRYTVTITAKTDHGVSSHAIASNDVSETFEALVRWYVGRVAPDEDPAAVLDVLLSASDLD